MSNQLETIYYKCPIWLQNVLVSGLGYRLYRKRYSGQFKEIRSMLAEARHWTERQRSSYQDEQLYELIRFCRKNVPYYQRLFAEYGIGEHDITHVGDIHKIPVLDKNTLQKYPELFRAKNAKPFIVQNTSGSTGTPLALAVDATTYRMAMALVVDHEEYHGIPFGSRRATFAGRIVQRTTDLSPPFWRFNRAENQRIYSSYHLNKDTFPAYRNDLDAFDPVEIIGYPSAIAVLAEYYESTDTQPQFRPQAIITNSETLLYWQRERIERVFQCPVRDYYGTAEYVVFAGQDKNGIYQINPTLGITEIVTDDANKIQGDIIATTLTNRCMPLLRYRVGDSATLEKKDDLDRISQISLASINGRIDDYIETPDGRKIGRIDHIFKGLKGIKEAQIIQDSQTHCTFLIVSNFNSEKIDESALKENFLARTGRDLRLTIKYTTSIPRSANGKFRSVIRNY